MPWMFSSGGSMISTLLASLGILVALFQSTWGLIAHRSITANTCLLLFAIGLCITYGNYDYLTSLSKSVGAIEEWSGLSSVPASLVQDTQYGKAIKKERAYSDYHYPSVDNVNSYVARLQIRAFLIFLSLLTAIAIIAYRQRHTNEAKSFRELILGLPAIILGLGGFGCILAMAVG